MHCHGWQCATVCKPGHVMHEKYVCGPNPPSLYVSTMIRMVIHTLRLKQGDVYKEYAVEIQDENAEEYLIVEDRLQPTSSARLPHENWRIPLPITLVATPGHRLHMSASPAA
jgi:hypothetical protein